MTEFLRQINISDFGSVVTGGTPSTSDSEMWGEGYPFVTPTEMDSRGMFPSAGRVVTEKARSALRTKFCPAGSVAVCCIGATIGKVVILPSASLTNQQINSIVVNETLHDFRFVYYLMRTQTARLRAVASGSATPLLNKSVFESLSVSVPPLSDQRAIAGVLGALDDKIDSNRRMADLLIRLARTMMSVGQYEVRLGDIAKCDKGLSYKGNGLEEKASLGIPMINLANFGVDGWLDAEKMKFYSGDYKERHLLKAGDLVVANTDLTQQRVIIGRPALVPPELGVAIFTHHVTAIRPIEDEELALPIWAQLNTPGFRERAEGFATGTTVAGLPVETLLDFQVQIPNGGVIRDARELLQRVWAAETESKSLTLTRDALLPELLSGRLRVKDAELMMENV